MVCPEHCSEGLGISDKVVLSRPAWTQNCCSVCSHSMSKIWSLLASALTCRISDNLYLIRSGISRAWERHRCRHCPRTWSVAESCANRSKTAARYVRFEFPTTLFDMGYLRINLTTIYNECLPWHTDSKNTTDTTKPNNRHTHKKKKRHNKNKKTTHVYTLFGMVVWRFVCPCIF